MSITNARNIDLCSAWITKRGAAYLCKEDQIVYYTSHTGRKSDYQWVKLSLAEVTRIIRVTMQDNATETHSMVTPSHLITAAQELDRVFEFGVKSPYKVDSRLFNYLAEADQDIGDVAMELLANEILAAGYVAMFHQEVKALYLKITKMLVVPANNLTTAPLILKHFQALGYEVRSGKHRPQVEGKKQPCILFPQNFPRDVVHFTDAEKERISHKVYGALR